MAAHAQHTSGTHHGMFERAEGVNIVNSTLVSGNISTTNGRKSPFDILKEAVAHTAFHDSAARFDPPKCHPNTRLAVLDKILQWVLRSDSETTDSFIMWLTGAAGAGKSAIMQSFIEQCLRDKIPVSIASFFFGRSDASRNHAGPLIATLAYQIYGHLVPSAQNKMLSKIDADPLIFTRSLDRQLSDLIAAPLQSVRLPDSSWPSDCYFLITVDGLDECLNKEAQQNIVWVISKAIQDFKLPFLFLVASRPEHDIKIAFDHRNMEGIYSRLYLDDTFHPDKDIRTFLQDSFEDIRTSHPFKSTIPSPWPVPETTDALVKKSSGQFIYAATVVRYVKSSRHKPHDRLQTVMNLRPSQGDLPFSQLDALYTMILSSAQDIGRVLYALSIYSPRIFQYDLHLSFFMSLEKGELEILFCDLGALVSIEGGHLKILHASLQDFLLDPMRSGKYFIGSDAYREQHLVNILGYLTPDPRSNGMMDLMAASVLQFSKEHFATYDGPCEMLLKKAISFSLAITLPPFELQNGIQLHYRAATFIIYCWLPFLCRMGRLRESWLSIQKSQEDSLDKIFLSSLETCYNSTYFPSWICLLFHAGTDQRIPVWCQNNRCTITNFWGPLYEGQNDPLWFRLIDIDRTIAGKDNDHYRRSLVQFLRDPRRSGKYALGPDTYTEATLFFIQKLNDFWDRLSEREAMEEIDVYQAPENIVSEHIWILNVLEMRPARRSFRSTDYKDDTTLALGYTTFFLSLSGWSHNLFDHCQRLDVPSKFMRRYPIHSSHLRQSMNEYVERFKAPCSSMEPRTKHPNEKQPEASSTFEESDVADKTLGRTHKPPSFLYFPDLVSTTYTTGANSYAIVRAGNGNTITRVAASEGLPGLQSSPRALPKKRQKFSLSRIFGKKRDKAAK